MSQIIYALTVVYFVYVVDEVEGERIVPGLKCITHVDLSPAHKQYRALRNNIIDIFRFKPKSSK